MKVLSLFDGISCGRIALDRAGIKVDKYYASEVDKYAIKVSSNNYPDIIQIGEVTKIDFSNYTDVNMIIAGSPCQGFSLSGRQLNFNDERSKLFFEFVKAVQTIKPKYFLLENVCMKKEYENIISELVGVEPVKINSSLVTAQSRNRLYWTNINFDKNIIDKKLLLKDVLDDEYTNKEKLSELVLNRFKYVNSSTHIGTTKPDFRKIGQRDLVYGDNNKMGCLMASDYKQPKQVMHNGVIRKISPEECEKLQTIPVGYTKGVSNTQRYKMIGNAWTVDVITHIFRGINGE